MESLGLPSIFMAVMIVVSVLKNTFKTNEKLQKLLPLIATVLGAIIGVVGFYVMPEIVDAQNVLQAFIFGAITGMGTTGSTTMFLNMKNLTAKQKEIQNALDSVNSNLQNSATEEINATLEKSSLIVDNLESLQNLNTDKLQSDTSEDVQNNAESSQSENTDNLSQNNATESSDKSKMIVTKIEIEDINSVGNNVNNK